jgi:hypothetical protein
MVHIVIGRAPLLSSLFWKVYGTKAKSESLSLRCASNEIDVNNGCNVMLDDPVAIIAGAAETKSSVDCTILKKVRQQLESLLVVRFSVYWW